MVFMPSSRVTMIIMFAVIAVIGLYFFVFKGSPSPETVSPVLTASSEPQASLIPSPSASESSPVPTTNKKNNMHQITLKTNFGNIIFETYDADAPKAVQNFITLAQKGFYKNLTFHRVIKDFMIQGGDPSGNGSGGPGYSFEDELNSATESYKQGYVKGVVAMANAGPNTNGSQFFIMLKDTSLPHNYTIFGKVISGQNVVDTIGNMKTNGADKPLESVIIKEVTVSAK